MTFSLHQGGVVMSSQVKHTKSSTHPRKSKYNNNNEHNLLVFYKIWKKFKKIQLTKNKMDLNNQKMKNHPPSPIPLAKQNLTCAHIRIA